jgi:hypothetical protein
MKKAYMDTVATRNSRSAKLQQPTDEVGSPTFKDHLSNLWTELLIPKRLQDQ